MILVESLGQVDELLEFAFSRYRDEADGHANGLSVGGNADHPQRDTNPASFGLGAEVPLVPGIRGVLPDGARTGAAWGSKDSGADGR